MWEAISHVMTSDHGAVSVLVILLIVVIVAIILTKSGLLRIHTSNFSLGGASRERDIIRHQIDEAHAGIIELLDKYDVPSSDYHTRYIFERIYDKIVEWIVFNHITSTPMYIDSKSVAIYNLIKSLEPHNLSEMPDLRKSVHEWTKNLIIKLIDVRAYYSDPKNYRQY